MTTINGARLIADLRRLAEFGKVGTGVDRVAYSPADIEARAWLAGRMAEAGLDARIDAVGNVHGSTRGARQSVVIGSHTDSVPKGGWLDGALGVLYGLEIARSRVEAGRAGGLGVDVVSFQDEEGTYLSCVGSRSFCGDLGDGELSAARSAAGEPLRDAIRRAGYGGEAWRLDKARHRAYLEAHIEQGPRLEAAGVRIGAVTGIVGIRRFRVRAQGQADHAGTTPMDMRRDAARPVFELAHWVQHAFPALGSASTVWNIGVARIGPGAANVVPSEAELVVEFRDTATEVLDRIEKALLDTVGGLNGRFGVELAAAPISRIVPTLMDDALLGLIERASGEFRAPAMRMQSGAGHDALVVGRVIPAAMLFIPSIGGRSHDIAEDTSEADIVLGCEVLARAVDLIEAAGDR